MEILFTNNLKEIEKELIEEGEVLINFENKTVHLQYSNEGYDYSIFDSKNIFDEDGEIDFDLCLDGGFLEEIEEEDTDIVIRRIFFLINEFNN